MSPIRTAVLLMALAGVACADTSVDTSLAAEGPASGIAPAPPPSMDAVLQAITSLPAEGLWPGFSPANIPVALFDGERTVLVAHPSPPEVFAPVDGMPGVLAMEGRHPSVRGNMPTEIAGVRTAAVMLEGLGGLTADRAAAVVAHERFHVHQLERHPDWTANELALFQYPATDAQQLFDRRLETLALHRSVQAPTLDQSECWLRTGLLLRRKRMAQLPSAVAEFERDVERQEGLARYIERRAAGVRAAIDIAPNGYAPEDVRGRAYVTGEALATMLDRYRPGWRDVVENADEAPALDSLLWEALAERPEMSCGFSAAERDDVLERATAAVNAIRADREAMLRGFEAQQGWTLRVISEAQPLWPQSFDPMSVKRVGSAQLIHERMLRAGNERGFVDVFDRPALSTGYLDDPLGSGMREVRINGLPGQPVISVGEDGRIALEGAGVEAAFESAHVTQMEQEVIVRVR